MLSIEEKDLIESAVENADCFGLGRISSAKEAIVDAGFKWTETHEKYCFDSDSFQKDILSFAAQRRSEALCQRV